ncbi:MAG: molybdopterin-synthase adenylyltransferase MoeB [Verrucomicrobiae bacterium]|nr:molybdopterin-synthase adenylyltransferase MoeB [Verrucomicrobiae bacterium]
MELSTDQLRRYARQVILPELGLAGQKKICAGSVVCVGAGGLGSPVLMYLAAAGVGKLGIVDADVVELPNLQRQVIHDTTDVGRPKTESAREKLERLNPDVQIVSHPVRLNSTNALEIICGYDVVVDATDNLPTRYLLNDACVILQKPLVYGAVFRFEGQASVLAPHLGGPCYRCIFPEPPPPEAVPSCAEAGVLGVLPGVIGCIQACEALKLLIGSGELLLGRLLVFDALTMRARELRLRRDPACPACGKQRSIEQLVDYEQFCGLRASQASSGADSYEVSVHELKSALMNPGSGITVVDIREPAEYAISHLPGTIHIPLGELARRAGELNPARTIYLLCKSGSRSLKAVALLRSLGFAHVKSVRGGLDAWRAEIDPRLPSY